MRSWSAKRSCARPIPGGADGIVRLNGSARSAGLLSCAAVSVGPRGRRCRPRRRRQSFDPYPRSTLPLKDAHGVGHCRRERQQALDDRRWPGARRRRDLVRARGGHVQRAAGPLGLRQVDDAAADRRSRDGRWRTRHHRRARRHHAAAGAAQHRDGVPELRAVSAPDRRREHPVRPARASRRPTPIAGRGSRASPIFSAWRRCSRASRRSSPAGSSSAWRWAARSSTRRRCA